MSSIGEKVKIKIHKGCLAWVSASGRVHREDGPAIERSNSAKEWYINGLLHREDGPAIEWADGTKSWYVNGKIHREDGPAIEYSNGTKSWYVNGKHLTEGQLNRRKSED